MPVAGFFMPRFTLQIGQDALERVGLVDDTLHNVDALRAVQGNGRASRESEQALNKRTFS